MTVAAQPRTERAQNGYAWLDEHQPGWQDGVDRDGLDMNDPCRCVLGQLLGSFYELPSIGLTYKQAARLGFDSDGSDRDMEALTQEWKRLLA